jgi:uroporphyrinogen III methyltransferase/synthase
VVVVGDVVRLRDELAWWERAPLFGRRVLVTRPVAQADEWAAALRAAGAEPVCVPMIAVAPVADERASAILARLDDYDAIVFTSANAARSLAERIRRAGREPASVRARILCVGEATAGAAVQAGFAEPEVPVERADVESLARALCASEAPGRRFLWPRGDLAGQALIAALRAAGALVDDWVVYATRPAELDETALRAALAAGELDALTFASPSAARRFAACLDEAARAAARRAAIAAIGATTAAALRELGLAPQVVPERADAPALVDALAAHFAARGRGDPR